MIQGGDGGVSGHQIQNAQGVDVDHGYVLIGLMIENACHICRQESDIHLIAGDHCRQLIGGGYHGKLIGILSLAVFGILHQLYQSHRGGAL